MKVLYLVLTVVSVLGEKAPPYPPSSAPYPPSGWKPSGKLFLLPQEEYGPPPSAAPPQDYGPPPSSAPPQEYGPPQQPLPPQGNEPPQNPPEEDLEKVNEMIMERLRQEAGSDTGVYYVYLPDGRLQRVQYTTAPVKGAQQQSSFSNVQQSNQQAVFGNHQVSTQSNTQTFGSFAKQQTSYDAPLYPPNPVAPSRFNQASSFRNDQFSQYNQQGSTRNQETFKSDDHKLDIEVPGSPSRIFARYSTSEDIQPNSPAKLNEEPTQPTKYVGSISFTNVAPITGPVFSYNDQPLVRVLRYAPLYQ